MQNAAVMNSKERFLTALRGECPDRLPVSTHHVMPSFLDADMEGAYILSPSDHFFEADLKLIEAFADEARKCTY